MIDLNDPNMKKALKLTEDAVQAQVEDNCAHYWIPNSGQGGEPDFRPNRQMSSEPLMHVKCEKCGCRTWFTEKQWWAIPATNLP